MKSVLLVITIHPPYFNYIYNLINRIHNRVDLFLIFSNKNDYDAFQMKTSVQYFILPESLNLNHYYETNSIVQFKRWYTLKYHLINFHYDFFVVFDAETDIIDSNFTIENLLEKIEFFFMNKTLFGGKPSCPNILKIIKNSQNVFKNNCENDLANATQNFSLYTFWSDIPVYTKEHLCDFFNKIDFESNNLEWHVFTEVTYSYYLILYHEFHIVDITQLLGICWSLESFCNTTIEKLKILKNHNYGFSFIIAPLFNAHTEFLMNEHALFVYHLDRHGGIH